MTASKQSLTGARDHLTITLSNESGTAIESDAKHFQFYHWQDGAWQLISPKLTQASVNPVEISPGASRQWRIILDRTNVLSDATSTATSTASPRDFSWFQRFTFCYPPGIYAFSYPNEGGDESVWYATQFEVTGEPLPLVPSDSVTETRRQDETLIVRVRLDGNGEQEPPRQVSLLANRLSTTPEQAQVMSRFELYNPLYMMSLPNAEQHRISQLLADLLRDGFAQYDGSATRIRVETRASVVPPVGLGSNESPSVVYDGTAWQLTSENGWHQ